MASFASVAPAPEQLMENTSEFAQLCEEGKHHLWSSCKSQVRPFDLVLFGGTDAVSFMIKRAQAVMQSEDNTALMDFSHIGYDIIRQYFRWLFLICLA